MHRQTRVNFPAWHSDACAFVRDRPALLSVFLHRHVGLFAQTPSTRALSLRVGFPGAVIATEKQSILLREFYRIGLNHAVCALCTCLTPTSEFSQVELCKVLWTRLSAEVCAQEDKAAAPKRAASPEESPRPAKIPRQDFPMQ